MHFSHFVSVLFVALAGAQSTKFPITGLQTGIDGTGSRPARVNINSLSGPSLDLYILGMQAFQQDSENAEASYYQVSGIHGAPFTAWNGVDQAPGGSGGYCPHGEPMFSTWHRPFVALFEQILAGHVQQIAAQYNGTNSAAYQAAANQFRLPYWDWADNADLPPVTTQPTISVTAPDGPQTIPNPLYTYTFQTFPHDASVFPNEDWVSYPDTERCPDAQGTSNPTLANPGLESANLRQTVYDVFSRATTFDEMTSTYGPGPSFENPHNAVHIYAGCSTGNMIAVAGSAFDPLFFLHHCNVDRLIAMWQAVHYDANMAFTSYSSPGALFSTAPGTTIDMNSPLKPFYDKDGNFYSSNSALNISAFGYSYPEVQDWKFSSQQDLAQDVSSKVNSLYGPASSSSKKRRSITARRDTTKEYFIELQADRSELPLPCTISIYLENQLAGSLSLLAMPASGPCHTEISLRKALALLQPSSYDCDEIIALVQEKVKIDIRKIDGTLVDVASVPSLKIDISGEDVQPGNNDNEMPKYSNPKKWNLPILGGAISGAVVVDVDIDGAVDVSLDVAVDIAVDVN